MDFREDDISSDLYGQQGPRSEGALHTMADYLDEPLRKAGARDEAERFRPAFGFFAGMLIGLSLSRMVGALTRPR